ncbi:MAG TPA: 50S ribosomal protein L7/L12 [Syntrophaceae bacterium]|nr:50S ribosomal protein L7/L12 [Syntrophaceae bacterium]
MAKEITREDVIEFISNMTVLELSQLIKDLEERFGVTAMAPTPTQASIPGAAPAEAPKEEKTEFEVVLTSSGDKKIQVIKVVRALTGLGLKEAKEAVENLPSTIKTGVSEAEAQDIKKQLEEAGATVEVK